MSCVARAVKPAEPRVAVFASVPDISAFPASFDTAKRIVLVTADTNATPDEGYTAGSHSTADSGTAIATAPA